MNISRRGLGSALLWAGLVVGTALNAHAASTSFQSPNTAAWGNWTRGTTGSLYVHWEEFDAYLKPGFPSALPDSKPDRGNFGAKSATVIPNNAGAFITGSGAGGNIYSFADINDFDVIVVANNGLASGPLTVALQVSVLGVDLADSSIKLNGVGYTSRSVLATGSSSAPGGSGGSGTGVDNEYLYLWQNVQLPPASLFLFDLRAVATSNSLDALSIDIGPMKTVVNPPPPVVNPPPPQPVPLPASLLLFGSALGTFVVRARSSA